MKEPWVRQYFHILDSGGESPPQALASVFSDKQKQRCTKATLFFYKIFVNKD